LDPYLGIGSLPAVNHQQEFAAAAVTSAADRTLLDGATALARTAAAVAADPASRERITQRSSGVSERGMDT
jgi:hypothetical protein